MKKCIKEEKGRQIRTAALTWVNTPYQDNAMAKGHGVDCAHFIYRVAVESDVIDEDDLVIGYYSNEWHLHHSEEKFLQHVQKVGMEIPKDTPLQVGDVLLYQYGRCVSHGAIYIGEGLIIHSYVELGVIISRLDDVILYDNKGESRLRHVYRFRDKGR